MPTPNPKDPDYLVTAVRLEPRNQTVTDLQIRPIEPPSRLNLRSSRLTVDSSPDVVRIEPSDWVIGRILGGPDQQLIFITGIRDPDDPDTWLFGAPLTVRYRGSEPYLTTRPNNPDWDDLKSLPKLPNY